MCTKRTNKLSSPELRDIFDSHDIVLLTETWTNSFSDLHVDTFECFVLHRAENLATSKRASGGICVYIKSKFVSDDTLVFKSEDDIICVKISGKILGLSKDLFICLSYVIPQSSSRQAFLSEHTYDRVIDLIVSINSQNENDFNFVLCGDLNSRCSDAPDFVVDDNIINLEVLPDDYLIDANMNRVSQDKGHIDSNGRLLLDLCKQTGLRILNGRVGNDKNIGRYTFVGSNVSSVVDYVLTTQNLLQNVDDFTIQEPNILSDHCMVDFTFSFTGTATSNDENDVLYDSIGSRYVWDASKLEHYKDSLSAEGTKSKLNVFIENVEKSCCNTDIDDCISELSNVFDGIASPLFQRKYNMDYLPSNENKNSNKWFTSECEEKRRSFYSALNLYRNEKSELNRKDMVSKRSEYKCCIRKARFDYDRHETQKLLAAREKNAKLY